MEARHELLVRGLFVDGFSGLSVNSGVPHSWSPCVMFGALPTVPERVLQVRLTSAFSIKRLYEHFSLKRLLAVLLLYLRRVPTDNHIRVVPVINQGSTSNQFGCLSIEPGISKPECSTYNNVILFYPTKIRSPPRSSPILSTTSAFVLLAPCLSNALAQDTFRTVSFSGDQHPSLHAIPFT